MFVEFGHNDAKSTEATSNYSANLTTFATKVKAKGGKTVLVTPTARNIWSGAKADNSALADFVAKMKSVAAAQAIDYLDLNAASISFIEALTPANSKKAYCYFPASTMPGQGAAVADGTHWNDYGAYELAKWMATAVKAKNLPFAKYLADDHVDFDPSKPDAYASFGLPFSPLLDNSFVPPESAVGPSGIERIRGSGGRVARIAGAVIRDGALQVEFEGDAAGAEIRLVAIDGTIDASWTIGAGTSETRTIPAIGSAGVRIVELRRDGRVLDRRNVLRQ